MFLRSTTLDPPSFSCEYLLLSGRFTDHSECLRGDLRRAAWNCQFRGRALQLSRDTYTHCDGIEGWLVSAVG